MARLLTLFVPALALTMLVGGGCASGANKPAASRRVVGPIIVSRSRPELRVPDRMRSGLAVDIRIEVNVDAAGVPDIATLRVTGLGATENHDAIASWILSAQFRPARREGQAVPGVFRTGIKVRARPG